jgi:hypothetical protein
VQIHGMLLLVVLALAVPTWTRERTRPTDIQGTLVWDRDTTDVLSITYRSPERQVEITRRSDEGGSFLWGQEVMPAADGASSDTLRFPVGIPGSELVRAFAEFRVLRDLGPIGPDRSAGFGLDEPGASITVRLSDGDRVIEVGDSTYGGEDFYGGDAATGGVWVLPAQLVRPLRIGSGAIRERLVHYFQDSEVVSVRVEAQGQLREMRRQGGGPGPRAIWTPPDAPDRPDQTFANFMERVALLSIAGFDPDVRLETLERVLRVEYDSEGAELLGFVELFREPGSGAYYLSSERTHGPARAVELLAERVAQDLPQIF